MEEKNVIITVESVLRRDTEQEAVIQRSQGILRQEGDRWLLTYREGDSGLGDTRTTLRLESGRAVLEREGEIRSRMVFQVGAPYVCLYETPYGRIPMTVETQTLRWELTGAGGRVDIVYNMKLAGADGGENHLRLTIDTKENGYDR